VRGIWGQVRHPADHCESTTELVARARPARFAEESSDRQEESEEHDCKPKQFSQTGNSERMSLPETLRKSVPPIRGVMPDVQKDVPKNRRKEIAKNKHEHKEPGGPHPFSVASPKDYQG